MKTLPQNGALMRFWRWFNATEPQSLPPLKRIVFGIPETLKEVRGIDPKAEAKLILRPECPAELVMLSEAKDSTHLLEDRGDYWLVDMEIRREVLIK